MSLCDDIEEMQDDAASVAALKIECDTWRSMYWSLLQKQVRQQARVAATDAVEWTAQGDLTARLRAQIDDLDAQRAEAVRQALAAKEEAASWKDQAYQLSLQVERLTPRVDGSPRAALARRAAAGGGVMRQEPKTQELQAFIDETRSRITGLAIEAVHALNSDASVNDWFKALNRLKSAVEDLDLALEEGE